MPTTSVHWYVSSGYNPLWLEIIMDPNRSFTPEQEAEYDAYITKAQADEWGEAPKGVRFD